MASNSGFWDDIGQKLWSIGKFMIPGISLFELLKWLINTWWSGLIDKIQGQFDNAMASLAVDLTPTGEFAAFLAKANSIVPVQETIHFIVLYLSIATAVLGIKWMRNLVPGIS